LKSYYVKADADEKLHQRVTVHNMSTIFHIFKACWCNLSSAKK